MHKNQGAFSLQQPGNRYSNYRFFILPVIGAELAQSLLCVWLPFAAEVHPRGAAVLYLVQHEASPFPPHV